MTLDDLRTCPDAALTVTAVAGLLHLDARTVRRACETEQIPSLKIGVRILIPTEYLRQRFCTTTTDMSADPAPTGPSTTTEPTERAFHHGATNQIRSA